MSPRRGGMPRLPREDLRHEWGAQFSLRELAAVAEAAPPGCEVSQYIVNALLEALERDIGYRDPAAHLRPAQKGQGRKTRTAPVREPRQAIAAAGEENAAAREQQDREARNARITELAALGVTLAEIGKIYDMSRQAVLQVLNPPDPYEPAAHPDATLAERNARILKLRGEGFSLEAIGKDPAIRRADGTPLSTSQVSRILKRLEREAFMASGVTDNTSSEGEQP